MPSKAPHANTGAAQKRGARRKRKHNAHTYERVGIEGALQVNANMRVAAMQPRSKGQGDTHVYTYFVGGATTMDPTSCHDGTRTTSTSIFASTPAPPPTGRRGSTRNRAANYARAPPGKPCTTGPTSASNTKQRKATQKQRPHPTKPHPYTHHHHPKPHPYTHHHHPPSVRDCD